jgi:hypothetical protein
MQKPIQQSAEKRTPPVVREYDIRGTKYIVTSTFRDGDGEDAVTKVRRLIRNDIKRMNEKLTK